MIRRISNFLETHGGTFKFWFERVQSYMPMFSFILSVYIAINVGQIAWYWYLLMIPGGYTLYRFDRRYVAQKYLAEFMKNNPAWRRMDSKLSAVMEAVGAKEEQPIEEHWAVERMKKGEFISDMDAERWIPE